MIWAKNLKMNENEYIKTSYNSGRFKKNSNIKNRQKIWADIQMYGWQIGTWKVIQDLLAIRVMVIN